MGAEGLTPAFLSWAAGIYDGEGWLYVKMREGAPDRKSRRFMLHEQMRKEISS